MRNTFDLPRVRDPQISATDVCLQSWASTRKYKELKKINVRTNPQLVPLARAFI